MYVHTSFRITTQRQQAHQDHDSTRSGRDLHAMYLGDEKKSTTGGDVLWLLVFEEYHKSTMSKFSK